MLYSNLQQLAVTRPGFRGRVISFILQFATAGRAVNDPNRFFGNLLGVHYESIMDRGVELVFFVMQQQL